MRFAADMTTLAAVIGVWPFIVFSCLIALVERLTNEEPLVTKCVIELRDDLYSMIDNWFPGCRFI